MDQVAEPTMPLVLLERRRNETQEIARRRRAGRNHPGDMRRGMDAVPRPRAASDRRDDLVLPAARSARQIREDQDVLVLDERIVAPRAPDPVLAHRVSSPGGSACVGADGSGFWLKPFRSALNSHPGSIGTQIDPKFSTLHAAISSCTTEPSSKTRSSYSRRWSVSVILDPVMQISCLIS